MSLLETVKSLVLQLELIMTSGIGKLVPRAEHTGWTHIVVAWDTAVLVLTYATLRLRFSFFFSFPFPFFFLFTRTQISTVAWPSDPQLICEAHKHGARVVTGNPAINLTALTGNPTAVIPIVFFAYRYCQIGLVRRYFFKLTPHSSLPTFPPPRPLSADQGMGGWSRKTGKRRGLRWYTNITCFIELSHPFTITQ